MALGYGYVKRDEPQQIDWGTIGKEMTDFIKSDQENRTKRKEEILMTTYILSTWPWRPLVDL